MQWSRLKPKCPDWGKEGTGINDQLVPPALGVSRHGPDLGTAAARSNPSSTAVESMPVKVPRTPPSKISTQGSSPGSNMSAKKAFFAFIFRTL